jgi:hypothetical protein
MTARKNAAMAARQGFGVAMEELEATVARHLAEAPAPRAAAPTPAPTPALPQDGDAALRARVAELEAELSRAERERDVARAALNALRAARIEEARMVEDALRDLREVV